MGAMSAAERPTGVFCANDMAAIGLLQGLTSMGIRVPDDIAIIGYDDIEFAAYAAVPLTSVAQPRRDIGATAATLLLAELEDLEAGRPHVHRSVMFTPSLVERASTALA
ncbi:substrate-binding domain-containing protein [Tessaracoccus coleopterorum]|uniref:substrate-binding domain-containing protein n=1 Tax=Tessaracoccus coleopterorum TaxID=2714950 RepID=UPI002F912384